MQDSSAGLRTMTCGHTLPSVPLIQSLLASLVRARDLGLLGSFLKADGRDLLNRFLQREALPTAPLRRGASFWRPGGGGCRLGVTQ